MEDAGGTTLALSWQTSEPATCALEDTPSPDDAVASTAHARWIVGRPPLTEVPLVVECVGADGGAATWSGTATTPGLPAELPTFTVTVSDPEATWPGYVLASVAGEVNAAVVLSLEGYPTWWYVDPRRDVVTSQALVATDGSGVWQDAYVMNQTQGVETTTELVHVGWDGTVRETVRAEGHHHDFTQLPDGTLAWIAYDYLEVDGEVLKADRILTQDPAGDVQQVWSTFDTYTEIPPLVLDPEGWTHSNALRWVPDLEAFALSVRNYSEVLVIDRQGEVHTRIGGASSDWTFPEDPPFEFQHGVDLVDGGTTLLVFDNGNPRYLSSRARAWTVDPETGAAEETFGYEPGRYSMALGDVERLPDGSYFTAWGTAGVMEQVSTDGQPVVTVEMDVGNGVGYVQVVESLEGFWGGEGGGDSGEAR